MLFFVVVVKLLYPFVGFYSVTVYPTIKDVTLHYATDEVILFCSPDLHKLCSHEELLAYLTTEGTCKCGLRCPFHLEQQFSFKPSVISLGDSDPAQDDPSTPHLCKAAHLKGDPRHHRETKSSDFPKRFTRSSSQRKNYQYNMVAIPTASPGDNSYGSFPLLPFGQKRPALVANLNVANTGEYD